MQSRSVAMAFVSLVFFTVSQSVVAADLSHQPMTVTIKRLSLNAALRIGKAAIEKCRTEGVQITVTVIDRGGHEQVVLSDVLAMDASIGISKKKAYTAMSFNSPTSALQDRFKGAYSVPKIDELMIYPGGVPITIAGNIVGGVGVSGAPSGLTDEACAQAGVDAIREDLELE